MTEPTDQGPHEPVKMRRLYVRSANRETFDGLDRVECPKCGREEEVNCYPGARLPICRGRVEEAGGPDEAGDLQTRLDYVVQQAHGFPDDLREAGFEDAGDWLEDELAARVEAYHLGGHAP